MTFYDDFYNDDEDFYGEKDNEYPDSDGTSCYDDEDDWNDNWGEEMDLDEEFIEENDEYNDENFNENDKGFFEENDEILEEHDEILINNKEPDENTGNKYYRWSFRYSNKELNLEEWQKYLKDLNILLKKICATYTYQLEDTNPNGKTLKERNIHIQGAIKLSKEYGNKTKGFLIKRFNMGQWKGCEINPTIDAESLDIYCSKKDSSLSDTFTERGIQWKGIEIENSKLYMWQNHLYLSLIHNNAVSRKIQLIYNYKGGSGKSFMCKYMSLKHKDQFGLVTGMGSAQQILTLISNVIGAKRIYFIDLPRSIKNKEKLQEVFTAIEKIKDGHIPMSSMYGGLKGGKELIMREPHVVVFTNNNLAWKYRLLSEDRFEGYTIGVGKCPSEGHLVPYHFNEKKKNDKVLTTENPEQN
jgi:hypothetical protein